MNTPEADLIDASTPAKLLKIMKDPVKSAKAMQLIYTTDHEFDGILRKKSDMPKPTKNTNLK